MHLLDEAMETTFGPQLARLELGIQYPLGVDRFRIDHGRDYFEFFRRLGERLYLVAVRRQQVFGGLAAIHREVPGGVARYIGDLKLAAAWG